MILINKILSFKNIKIDQSIINTEQIKKLVYYLLESIENEVKGDIVEFGCYVGESSKYLMKTLVETKSKKKLYLYDSFDGLPSLSKWEENTGWKAGTLKTSKEILIANFNKNNLPTPIIHKDWFKDIPEDKIPEKISFAFLDGDFYDSIYDSLNKIFHRVTDGGYICFHDYQRNDLPGVKAAIEDFFRDNDIEFNVVEVCNQLGVYKKNGTITTQENYMNDITLVTGLWDLGRNELSEGWSRSYEHYLNKFSELLKTESNLIIFGDEKLKNFVFERRPKENTHFIVRDLDWFKNNDYYDKIQSIRNKPEWYNQVGWLSESTQARLELYNPLVMSKMFLLHDAKILDPFDSDYMFWIDAGLTNTVHPGYFTHDKVLDKLPEYTKKFSFICFPYKTESEIHGFEIKKLNEIAESSVEKVARGGFFGGPKSKIAEVNSIYYGLLLSTLSDGYMGTEESIFSIMCYKHADIINHFDINADGLMSTFFENLKNDTLPKEQIRVIPSDISKVGLYVLTFNSPEQFRELIKTMLDYDKDFIDKPQKFLLDNSTDLSTSPLYKEICNEYGFEHIKVDNVGICGGRQWIAEHFQSSDNDYMFFFEDDMFFYQLREMVCRNGFNRYVAGLYEKSLEITQKNNFDFLKLNFSEFYGDNGTQWAWYNVPQNIREKYWPENNKLPEQGFSPNAPKTEFKHVHVHGGIPYATGDIYYCNWPQVVSREGNKKMFLDTKWAHPYEQTWMSYMFQLTKDGKLNPAILLLTPTEHNRFDFYDGSLRKES